MATTEAQKKATLKYMNEKLDDIRFRVPKGEKERIRTFAGKKGLSMTAYIIKLIKDDMEKDVE